MKWKCSAYLLKTPRIYHINVETFAQRGYVALCFQETVGVSMQSVHIYDMLH